MSVQAAPPTPASQPSGGVEIVHGKDLPHWSGLPILGETAKKLGFEIPEPFGLSATYYAEKQSFRMPKLELGGHNGKLFNANGLVRVPEIRTSQSAKTIRADAWVFPFFNLYALVGYVDGHANIDIQPALFPPNHSPKYDLRLDYEGPTVGLGGTLATGFKPFKTRPTIVFGLVDLNVTQTFLDFRRTVTSLEPVTVGVLNMRCGVRDRVLEPLGDFHLSLWGGLMWEGVQDIMTGNLSILDLDFKGKVKSVNPVNTIVGSRLEIGKHIDVMFDVGIGERRSVMLSGTFRF